MKYPAEHGTITQDLALLRALEDEIPILEEKLRAMKVTRQRLKASIRMRAKRKDRAFNAVMLEAVRRRLERPEVRAHFLSVRHTGKGGPLPFAVGTPERQLYHKLRISGFTRAAAIAEIRSEAP